MSIISCMYQVSTISHSTLGTVYYYYVSEHHLSHVIDASHTLPTTRANRGHMLLKLINWRHCPCFRWVPYIPGTMPQSPSAKPGLTAISQ